MEWFSVFSGLNFKTGVEFNCQIEKKLRMIQNWSKTHCIFFYWVSFDACYLGLRMIKKSSIWKKCQILRIVQ